MCDRERDRNKYILPAEVSQCVTEKEIKINIYFQLKLVNVCVCVCVCVCVRERERERERFLFQLHLELCHYVMPFRMISQWAYLCCK